MKIVAVLYATREGHTRQIAEHVAASLRILGIDSDVRNVKDQITEVDLASYDGVVLAASVHLGRHEREMVKFARDHRAELEQVPSAFLSVTLSEAGAEQSNQLPERRAQCAADVHRMIEEFIEDTGWRPGHTLPVAGALLYTRYNPLVRFAMKQAARSSGGSTDTSQDHDYTDWTALDRFTSQFAKEIGATAVK